MTRNAGNEPGRSALRAWLVLSLLGPALAAAAIWLPLWRVYHVPEAKLSPLLVEASRSEPGASEMAVLEQIRWTEAGALDRALRLRLADDALAGRLELPGAGAVAFGSPTDERLLRHGDGRVQLLAASMRPADDLLQAYRLNHDRRYFEAALAMTLNWADFDAGLRIPLGLVWNDHALAARLIYLARFWEIYRQDAVYAAETARRVLAFAYRTAERLARPSLYAARTNHGIMQNLALLHAAVAFPELPGTAERTQIALDRLARHLGYYVSPDGLVLEHSASYQELGVELLRSLQLYLAVLKRPDPRWQAPAEAARCLLRALGRPEGSLPWYGDSHGRLVVPGMRDYLDAIPAADCLRTGLHLDAEFGYLLDNDAAADQQLFIAWTNFPGAAHKHADELSAYLWYGGIDWWGASGYWPYSDPQRGAAVGWRGANAPHVRGESSHSQRQSRLLSVARDQQYLAADLLRVTGTGQLRRQILRLRGGVWLVIDSANQLAADQEAEVLWSLAPELQVRSQGTDRWSISAAGLPLSLELGLAGAASGVRAARGGREPFAAMTALADGGFSRNWYWPVSFPSGGWALSAWIAADDARSRLLAPPEVDWQSAEQWSIRLALRDGARRISRNGEQLKLHGFANGPATLLLQSPPPVRGAYAAAVANYQRMLADYPYFRDLVQYRWRATAGVTVLGLLQLSLLLLWRRIQFGRPWWLVLSAASGWCLVSSWLAFIYLR